tara:strand:+ start:625 stop:1458 length:834 start_codon:yes stop_codon:yes gene_type:complete
MRRGIKFSKRAYIVLGITALFNLLSIVFDQLVVQQEDKIRIYDRDISIHKLETDSLLYSHKVFDELMFKVHFSAASMIGDLNYLTRTINYLNSELPKKMDSDKIDNIKKTYINKTRNVVEQFRTTKKDTKTIFNKIIEDHIFTKSIEKKRTTDSPFKPYKDIQEIKIALDKEYKIENFLTNYNFNAQTADEQNLNYPIYQNLYDEMLDYNWLKNNFNYLSNDFKAEFTRSYSQYFILLDNFAEKQNNKNYLILLSILFQITGLVFLVLLFRILIEEN